MKVVASLIRLHRWQLDEKRRVLAGIEQFRDDLQHQIERLEAEIAAEQQTAAAAGGDAAFAYGNYALGAIARRATLNQSLADVERQITVLREQVAEAFQELKKYELLQEQRGRRARDQQARRQTAEQDEIGLQGFRRRGRDKA